MIRIVLVGDYRSEVIAHDAIPKALALAAESIGERVTPEWLPTAKIDSAGRIRAKNPSGIWCVPGSPYVNMEGALTAIAYARENRIPFLGTCGGFQHAVIEYARNVLKIREADHTESNPLTGTPVISKLSCALINRSESIRIDPNSRLAQIYGSPRVTEAYQCSYGFNPAFRERFEMAVGECATKVQFPAFNDDLEIRALELTNHPFFVATLFQPERSALTNVAHRLIVEFLRAASASRQA